MSTTVDCHSAFGATQRTQDRSLLPTHATNQFSHSTPSCRTSQSTSNGSWLDQVCDNCANWEVCVTRAVEDPTAPTSLALLGLNASVQQALQECDIANIRKLSALLPKQHLSKPTDGPPRLNLDPANAGTRAPGPNSRDSPACPDAAQRKRPGLPVGRMATADPLQRPGAPT